MYEYFDLKTAAGKRSHLMKIATAMKLERSSYHSHYSDLETYILPTRGRFFTTDLNKGWRRNHDILDSTASQAVRTTKAGMMAGITSPARPWFKLGAENKELNLIPSVTRWLDQTTQDMRNVFIKSNFYEQTQILFGDVATFATSCMYVEEDFDKVVRFQTEPVGSYYFGINEHYKIDKYFREYSMTVRQIVNKFGKNRATGEIDWKNISMHVKNLYESGNHDNTVIVGHVVMPNDEYDPKRKISKFKKYSSFYFEMGSASVDHKSDYMSDEHKILSEMGYDLFPVLGPRWEVTGEDIYGSSCPGFLCIGDVIQLQEGERKALKAIDKMIDPPLVGPTSLKNQRTSLLPNDITYLDETSMAQLRPVHAVNFDINAMEMKQKQVRERINKAYFVDLFLMLANSDRRQITAKEIEERHEEKLLALGPVLENLNNDFLDPVIDLVFSFMEKQGLLAEPPDELKGQPLKVEYISIMAQAQKAIGLGAIDRTLDFAVRNSQAFPDILKKINPMEALDEYADLTGAPTRMIRSNDEVEEMKAGEQQAMQAQAQMQGMQQMASTAKDLSQASMEDDNVLKQLLGR